MTESQTARYVRRPGVMARRVAGEMVLVPLDARTVDELHRTAELFVLNATAERLWELLASPISIADLARNLIDEFEVSEESARADAAAFIQSLRDIGIAVEAGPGDDERR